MWCLVVYNSAPIVSFRLMQISFHLLIFTKSYSCAKVASFSFTMKVRLGSRKTHDAYDILQLANWSVFDGSEPTSQRTQSVQSVCTNKNQFYSSQRKVTVVEKWLRFFPYTVANAEKISQPFAGFATFSSYGLGAAERISKFSTSATKCQYAFEKGQQ